MLKAAKKLPPAAIAAIAVLAILLVFISYKMSLGGGLTAAPPTGAAPAYAKEMSISTDKSTEKGSAAQTYGSDYGKAPSARGGPPGMPSGGYGNSSGTSGQAPGPPGGGYSGGAPGGSNGSPYGGGGQSGSGQ